MDLEKATKMWWMEHIEHGHDGSGEADIFGDVQHPNGVVSCFRAADEMEQTTLVTVRSQGNDVELEVWPNNMGEDQFGLTMMLDLVLGVYSKVGYAGTFPEAVGADNYLVTKLCCRHLRPNPYT
jgi:hypothetical protein